MNIYKFPLVRGASQHLSMPRGARVLKLDWQYGEPAIWCAVDVDAPMTLVEVITVPTGSAVPEGSSVQYIGSLQEIGSKGFSYVWHYFVRA